MEREGAEEKTGDTSDTARGSTGSGSEPAADREGRAPGKAE
jgi:hypothetical protein